MQPWDVMVDLFFYRDPEEVEQQAKEEAAAREAPEVIEAVPPPADWDAQAPPVANAGDWGAPPGSNAPPMQPTAERGAAVPAAPGMGGDWGAQDTNWN